MAGPDLFCGLPANRLHLQFSGIGGMRTPRSAVRRGAFFTMSRRDLITYRRRGLLFWRSRDRILKNGERSALVRSRPSKHPISQPTRTQDYFVEWNAVRLGISREESRTRYIRSWNTVPHGHSGRTFENFHGRCYELFKVFADDSPKEVMEAYKMHGHVHFLNMLTYPEPRWFDDDAIVKRFRDRKTITILDFGCGLAQQSRTLAEYLLGKGLEVSLVLADIPTIRKDFLMWWGNPHRNSRDISRLHRRASDSRSAAHRRVLRPGIF